MSDGLPPEDVLALLGDEYARRILVATQNEPMTASNLADEIDAAPSTVYERIDDLERAGFLSAVTLTDDEGNHYAEYSTRLDGLSVRVTADGFDLSVARRERDEAAERLHALWGSLR